MLVALIATSIKYNSMPSAIFKIFIILNLLTKCSMENRENSEVSKNTIEIIFYSTQNSGLEYSNGQFKSTDKGFQDSLNEELKNYQVKVSELKNNSGSFEAKNSQRIFILKVTDKSEKLRDFLLKHPKQIDAAYIKKEAEDPDMSID